MKTKRIISYLKLVPSDGTPPDFTPPCPPAVDPLDWQILWHSEAIWAGEYDWFIAHGGPFVSDAELKAQGKIPPQWSRVDELMGVLFGSHAQPRPATDSTDRE